ncbi:NAD(P)/FAD-dependent oxidoreductase [Nocardioides sp.]|uniref:dihydrolipoyl dehydrogenase family protein n=1 Tax=Nocardioides sp. TaxID=35761 RepID=UPI0035153562
MSTAEAADATHEPWDLVVVGGGTAGLVAAKTAARLGARVLLVESDRTGGDCLWTGCVPSKALLAAAHGVARARGLGHLGIDVGALAVDLGRVRAHVRATIAAIEPHDSVTSLVEVGVSVRRGRARFTGPDEIIVAPTDGGQPERHRFLRGVLATGASPTVPATLDGLDTLDPPALTSETVWELERLPARLVVLGAGAIGVELGQALQRLGSRVTLVEAADRILPGVDPDAAAVLTAGLLADGIDVRTGRRAVAVTATAVVLDDGASIPCDRVLLALGRTPRTADLGLEAAGVRTRPDGTVEVDPRLRTTNPRLWAAGDLTGHPQHTHVAGTHGSLAASNAVLGLRRRVAPAPPPRVVFTDPEIAAVGAPTAAPPPGGRVVSLPHTDLDRAVAEGRTDGFSRLAIDRRGRVVGATIVAPRAGEMLGELSVAVARGLRTRQLGAVTHPYPAWTDGPWQAALADLRTGLESPRTRRATGTLVRWRRRRLPRPGRWTGR